MKKFFTPNLSPPPPFLLLLFLLLSLSLSSSTHTPTKRGNNAIGKLVVLHDDNDDITDLYLPAQAFPYSGEPGDLLAEWAAWTQRVFQAVLFETGRAAALEKADKLLESPLRALPSRRVRFVRRPFADFQGTYDEGSPRQKTRRDVNSRLMKKTEFGKTRVSPVFEIGKGDVTGLWKTMTDRKYDNDEFLNLRVLSWNLFLVTKLLGRRQDERAPLFGKYVQRMGDFDAVCLSECFTEKACKRALKSVQDAGYKYITKPVNKATLGGLVQGAGVYIASKHEIVDEQHLEYSDHWTWKRFKSKLNYVVRRGAVIARMRTADGYYFNMGCTHPDYSKHRETGSEAKQILESVTGTDLDAISKDQRLLQLRELRVFVDRHAMVPDSEPLIFAGDFNVDKKLYAALHDGMRLDGVDALSNGKPREKVPLPAGQVGRLFQDVDKEKRLGKMFMSDDDRAKYQHLRSAVFGTPHVRDTLSTLEVELASAFGGALYTLDHNDNDLVHTKKSKYLDYIFVDGRHRVSAQPFVQWCIPIKLDEEDEYAKPGVGTSLKRWTGLGKVDKFRDLSDHYPVVALLRFRKVDLNPANYDPRRPLAAQSESVKALLQKRGFVDPATLPVPDRAAAQAADVYAQDDVVADPLMLYPAAATRMQNMFAVGDTRPRPVLHPDFRTGSTWRHFFRYNERDGLFHVTVKDRLSIFAQLTERPVNPPDTNLDIRTMIFNVLAPAGAQRLIVSAMASEERVRLMPKYIKRLAGGELLDAVCFAECFLDKLCNGKNGVLRTEMQKMGYHVSAKANTDKRLGLLQDAGVFVATPHEIVEERNMTFDATASKWDCFRSPANCATQRGAVHLKLKHRTTGKIFHVLCASLEYAGKNYEIKGRGKRVLDEVAMANRVEQIKALNSWVGHINEHEEPLVLMADTNFEVIGKHAELRSFDNVKSDSFIMELHQRWLERRLRTGGETFSADPNDNTMLATLYPSTKPRSSNIIMPSRTRSEIDLTKFVRSKEDRSKEQFVACVTWIPRVRLDPEDEYPAPSRSLFTKFADYVRGKTPDKWGDLAIDYPVMARIAFSTKNRNLFRNTHVAQLMKDPAMAARYDPTIFVANSYSQNTRTVAIGGVVDYVPDDVWDRYVKYTAQVHQEGGDDSDDTQQTSEQPTLGQTTDSSK